MLRMSGAALALVMAVLVAPAALAQYVNMSTSTGYSETNGIVVNIPQNPPTTDCVAPEKAPAPNTANDARCHNKLEQFFGNGTAIQNKPAMGVLPNPAPLRGETLRGGLTVDASFTLEPFAFSQMLGVQVGQVIGGNGVIQLDTDFTAAMPAAARSKLPPAETRVFARRDFSTADRPAFGQNNGLTTMDANYDYRTRLSDTAMAQTGLETLTLSYSNANPTGFTGTSTILLDRTGRLYLGGPGIDGAFGTPNVVPIIATNPVGDTEVGFRVRNAAGWNYTVTGSQASGLIKGFPPPIPDPIPNGLCGPVAPPSPPGCNLVAGFDTFGIELGSFGAATSTKFMFPWTTGTVVVARDAVRRGIPQNLTVTARGHNFTSMTAGGTVRQIGLVAGSFTVRTDGQPTTNINHQMAGVNITFTPEPGSTIALVSGLGLLVAAGVRRRRS